jgi:hypothetical protein
MFLTQRVIRLKSIAICVASRDAITQYIGTTFENVQHDCDLFPHIWPSNADVNTQKWKRAARFKQQFVCNKAHLRVLSLENMLQNCDLFLLPAMSQRRQISKEPGLGPEKPINESLLDTT